MCLCVSVSEYVCVCVYVGVFKCSPRPNAFFFLFFEAALWRPQFLFNLREISIRGEKHQGNVVEADPSAFTVSGMESSSRTAILQNKSK